LSITLLHREKKQKTVSPRDCALLIGIPLDEEAFHVKYRRPKEGNFAQSVVDAEPEFAWSAYSFMANRFAESVDEVERMGVRVWRCLTKENLTSALSCEVVTIATQWRSAELLPADVAGLPALKHELEMLDPGDGGELTDEEIADRLNFLLNKMMRPCGEGVGAATRRQLELLRCRTELQDRFQSKFSGGAGIEFSDGFHSLDEVAHVFPASFDCVVDLTVCNSLALAEMIRRRCNHALAIAMGDITRPHLRFPMYVAVMRLLERRPATYEAALTKLFDWMQRQSK